MCLLCKYGITRIDYLADEKHCTYAQTTDDINELIHNGILSDAYVYHRDKEIILPGVSKKIALRCKTCTGTTVLYTNEERICDYCGGWLS